MVRNAPAQAGFAWLIILVACLAGPVFGQLVDKNKAPNIANEGITRPLMRRAVPESDRRRQNGH